MTNRRFVPFHFDLFPGGFLGDKEAKQWVKEHLPEFAGSMVSTPPVVFVTPDGKLVGQESNYASTSKMLKTMRDILKEHPEYNKPCDQEAKVTSALERAEILIDLVEYVQAEEILETDTSQQALYLKARLARFQNQWDKMERYLAQVTEQELLDDVRMERAYRHWNENDFVGLSKHLDGFPKSSNRYSEACYFQGLAAYHAGNKDQAREIWKETIKSCPQDRWIYRADWAFCESIDGQKRAFSSSGGSRTSQLGRIGYMGAKHPDLKSRRR